VRRGGQREAVRADVVGARRVERHEQEARPPRRGASRRGRGGREGEEQEGTEGPAHERAHSRRPRRAEATLIASRRFARRAAAALLFGLAAWFLWRTGREAGWGALRDRLAGADAALLAAAAGLTLARYAIWAGRWQWLARPVSRFRWWPAAKALMASLFVTTVVPGSRAFGGLVRAQHLGRETGQPIGRLYGGAAIDQFGYSVVSMAMGALFLPVAFWGGPSGDPGNRRWLYAGGLLMAAGCAAAWWRRRSILERLRRRTPAIAGAVEEVIGAAGVLLRRPVSWAVMGAGGAAVYAANVVTFQVAAAALGWRMGFVEAAGAFSIGSLAGTVVNTPGGVGTTEAAATLFLQRAAGVPADVALAAVFLARGMHYLCSLALGGAAFLAGGTARRAAAPETRAGPART
jgi:uncharacterized membrane protein YbhN (UPF0104 family)